MTGVSSKFQLSSSVQTIVINYLKMGVYSGPSEVRHFCRISGEKTAGHFFSPKMILNGPRILIITYLGVLGCPGVSGCHIGSPY